MESWLNTHDAAQAVKIICFKCLLSLFHRENTSVSVEPMDDDFYNNNVTNSKPGVKRRAAEELQSGISQVKLKNLWCIYMIVHSWGGLPYETDRDVCHLSYSGQNLNILNRWLNTALDTCTTFAIFQKLLIPGSE